MTSCSASPRATRFTPHLITWCSCRGSKGIDPRGRVRDNGSQFSFEQNDRNGVERFNVPHRPSVGLEKFPVETTIGLPTADQARLAASSDRDLADMVVIKFGQTRYPPVQGIISRNLQKVEM
ncbi:hypothetical protein DM860_006130 [Cuscuta australis]|uniref:Uncharacterized protein n=1 Tax=Cuscuta australis TaxID=267555 RepID=A0A328DKI7_9ASTE|nr:hypothetical protein DM860_006130 [Cuscuta australis]